MLKEAQRGSDSLFLCARLRIGQAQPQEGVQHQGVAPGAVLELDCRAGPVQGGSRARPDTTIDVMMLCPLCPTDRLTHAMRKAATRRPRPNCWPVSKERFNAWRIKTQEGPRRALPINANLSLRRTLTGREHEVLQFIVHGPSNKRIAAKVGISLRTVKTHRSLLMMKTEARNVADLVRYAIRGA